MALIGISSLLGLLLIFGIVLALDWPWWVGIFVLIGLTGIGLFVFFGYKLWLKRREQHFVSQIVSQDDAYMKSLQDDEKRQVNDLQDRWKEAVEALKSSHLKKFGNPLYVLPWYLVMGESGAGKTTAIKSAHLSSPFAEINRVSGFSGTKNCDWWFFEQAVLIDTAGRYAIPIDEGRDRDEWQRFLGLLSKYRKKEPLNGLVVSVAADKLLESDSAVLTEDGKNIRRRIDELMRVLEARFPVYVLITKCDLVQGMTQFCEQLSEKNLEQAFGMINHTSSPDTQSFLKSLMHTILERLRNIRLLQLHKIDPAKLEPSMLLFPEEFARIEQGLDSFMKGAFQENPYQESPLLRGVYFSSGRQEGTPYSHFLKNLGLIEERDVLPGTNKGLFLHDFFAKILPRERHLFAPTQRALEWNRLTKNIGLLSWIAIMVAFCGLLSFSFVKNLSIIRSIPQEFSHPPVLQGEIITDLGTLDRYRQAILVVEKSNSNWWIPRFGLDESTDVETGLKNTFCSQVTERFLANLDQRLTSEMTTISSETTDLEIGRYIALLVRRINLLNARITGEELEQLQLRPQASFKPVLSVLGQRTMPEINEKFSELYLYRLAWTHDTAGLNSEMNELQELLTHIVSTKIKNMQWLAAWINEDEPSYRVTLKGFWEGSGEMEEEPHVPSAYTLQGKNLIDSFQEEIKVALVDPLIISSYQREFQSWYRVEYLNAWHHFADVFDEGSGRLKGRDEWRQAALRIGEKKGPYESLSKRMSEELKPYTEGVEQPAWVRLIYEMEYVKNMASTMDFGEKGALAKVKDKGAKIKHKLEDKVGKVSDGLSYESQLIAARACNTYQKTIAELALSLTSSREISFKLSQQTLTEDAVTSDSPFFIAKRAIGDLTGASAIPAKEPMWKLASGPIVFLWSYACKESACQLQDLWESEVLVEVQGISDYMQANDLLLGKGGFSTKFIQGNADPFLGRDLRKGYYSKALFGYRVAFDSEFLTYITRGERPVKPNYRVSVTGLPTDVNTEAVIKPHATHLELQCQNETLTLTNLNYPARKVFNWSPQTCSNVVFTIEVGSLTLIKEYTGSLAFAKFLNDFRTGQHVFRPGDFPKYKSSLRRVGIKYFKVRYRLKGHTQVIKILTQGPGKVPEKIVTCWDQ